MTEQDPSANPRSLRESFDSAAALYHRARPDYPPEIFEDLIRLAGVEPGDRLLEVGCGTGKATLAMARRGFSITVLELGPELAEAARENLAGYPNVEVVTTAFESFQPSVSFDLVYAATAWHWVDPNVKYRRAWECLNTGGHLAFWSAAHVFPEGGDSFFRDIQAIYDEIGEGMPPGTAWPRPGELADSRAEIVASAYFQHVEVRQYAWEIEYDPETYVDLLDTFSGHIAMEAWQRDRLYGEIRQRLSARQGGRLRRGWGAVLHVAQRVG